MRKILGSLAAAATLGLSGAASALPPQSVIAAGPASLYYRMGMVEEVLLHNGPIRSCQWHGDCAY